MNKAILCAINNYGEGNLRGCLNDQKNLSNFFSKKGYEIITLSDSECTCDNVQSILKTTINNAVAGDKIVIAYSGHGTQLPDLNGDEPDGYDEALYLYDRPLTDDRLNEVLNGLKEGVECVILLDSCFSGTATRGKKLSRYFQLYDIPVFAKRNKSITRNKELKWVVISGCSENQTSADAYIGNAYCGAFTHYLLKCYKEGMSIKEWFVELRKTLPNKYFDQIPTIEGNRGLFNIKL